MKRERERGFKLNIPILRIPYEEEDIRFIQDEIEKVLKSGFLTMASRVKAFEEQFASFCGVKYAIGTNTGTSSLEIILRAVDVEGKTVIMPSNTYMATPLAAIKAGGKVIFTECERENLQMDPDDLKDKIREDTKAVVLVHIGGIISPRLNEIRKICGEHKVTLIEDAAHAHGATIDQHKAGNLGDAASFSFYPTKVLTTAEGGMLTTNDGEIYKKAIILREHGKADNRFNIHTEIGDNWRFSELHAVLGLQQMKRVEWILNERRRLASLYDEMLKDIQGITLIKIPEEVNPAYYKYIVFLDKGLDRSVLKKNLKERYGVTLTGEVYSDPCHSQPVFEKYPDKIINKMDSFPNTDYVCKHHVCLPLYPGLKDEEVEYVVDSLKSVLRDVK
jgi:dTDP-4-amino-4,6-dideoxygalactose transaminase